ncbi:MAG: FAD-dependent oxidoreductase [Planctomycetota bacterium]
MCERRWNPLLQWECGMIAMVMLMVLACPVWSQDASDSPNAVKPATAGIPWEFEGDNPSAAALIGFRKPPRVVKEVVPGFLWIDAEDFSDYGGWWLDTQFVHLMGSGYLIANGIDKPVAPASTEVEIPRAGTYRLWVRTRDWLPEYSPGQFRVAVGDRVAEPVFGRADRGGWVWESGGSFELEKGAVQLELRDLSGEYSRCDALVLTTEANYVPPADTKGVIRERARLTGLDLKPSDGGEYDVVVVGAGAAGCCAAIAAARNGAETALIQNRPVLGGNASLELGVGICGAAVSHANAREGGIIEAAGRLRTRHGFHRMSEPFRILSEQEDNLSVFLNEHVHAVEMSDDEESILAVRAVDTFTGVNRRYRGSVFIDCTGDGWVGYYAGADYRFGRESREEFGEDLAPREPDEITMSGCIMGNLAISFRAKDQGYPVTYEPPDWALELPSPKAFGRRIRRVTTGEWWLEHPGTFNDLEQAERARDELIRITFGFWDYLKNHWPDRASAARYQLVYVPIRDARRETRRLMADYILKQQDVLQGRVFPDRIAHGGWPLDVHHPQGILSGPDGPFDCNPHVPLYTIPYRCLYSRNVSNLLFAGRHVSVTHLALGSVRVQGTLATLGQAAGTAAAMCVQRQATARGIYQRHLIELQQTLLKQDQYIPELKNEDPSDLALQAAVTASSTARFEQFGSQRARGNLGDIHEFTTSRATMFPVGVDGRIDQVHLCLRSTRSEAAEVTLHLRGAEQFADYSSNKDLATATAKIPPGQETWVTFPIDLQIDTPYAWVWLPRNPDFHWRLMNNAPRGSCRAYGGAGQGDWTVLENQFYACYTSPPRKWKIDSDPENVINGVSRPVGDRLNVWSSDPNESLPQSIQLQFDHPRRFDTVRLTFDTNMNSRHHEIRVPVPPECVRDYELEAFCSGQWQTVVSVEDNFQRHRVHHFDSVAADKLRLTVNATHGARSARVFEIRVGREH